ncbi:tRNA lysidine(34) synthetase TilS [Ruegeria lacuscaerulensis]|uniref:tRNA lysidine(34) synthetase TilS n=1 Tax=Ruegeria lacuscaerulensis TaxID=55218 RepID=UPI00147F74A1|nr:tRNA lysidine(34) synthetase TilS [Ruegeria lacuscaerulensis]
MTTSPDKLKDALRRRLPAQLPARLGVAVSGGGDSVALLHLLAENARAQGVSLYVATVDHGLRPESSAEADRVAEMARDMGLPHEVLRWTGWDGSGNLQDQARQARYRLLTDWARRNDVPAIALGHTADDQAETVLLRLGRASGVTGLSGMPAARELNEVQLLRPLLDVTRQELRDYLNAHGLDWIEDPSNHDLRFDRIKAREALAGLEEIGITARSLSRVADNLAQAREALDVFTQETARRVLRAETGDICVDRAGFVALPSEIQRRLLVGSIQWIAGAGYPPRQMAVEQALSALRQAETTTIGGCMVVAKDENTWICRELGAISVQPSKPGDLWDSRWILTGPQRSDAQVRPLAKAGLRQLPDWRALGKPRAALVASPAIWAEDTLLSAPLAGFSNGWRAELASEVPELHSSFLSH